ncbi:hypothetical protein C7I85_10945 [Mesorhizobium soli]|uniref:Uncharacterized protein n=1 Tax=Pseudaminobacter soli (ex Li et al. 2025) TaxID=1295366 RepID=A0A2P7SGU4_9HYPH|nr:hypothetical protein C7I85_10945 [Mesorhizobium soli]
MKNIVLASILAIASAISFGIPAQAGTTVRTYHGHYHGRPHCYVKKVRYYKHGRVYYRSVRVCR